MTVVKADTRQVPFDENRIFQSVNQATDNWHSPDQVRALVRAVTDQLFGSAGAVSVRSAEIGEAVAAHLKILNPVSHIRFALAFVGRLDHRGDGMQDARAFRRWMLREYPHLERLSPAAGLSSVYKIRSGSRQRFDREKLKSSALIAYKGRGAAQEVDRLASDATNAVMRSLGGQPLVTTGQIAAEMMRYLRSRDDIAYLRYASAAKQFSTENDYDAEAISLANERREYATRTRAR